MTVITQTAPARFGVFHRAGPRRPWKLIVCHADKRECERLLIDLASSSKLSGDWRCGPVEGAVGVQFLQPKKGGAVIR